MTTTRAARTEKALAANDAPAFAVLHAAADPAANAAIVTGMATGDVARAVTEYSLTPTADLAVLTGIRVKSHPVPGRANCSATRVVTMGSDSITGDFRHELGHAIHMALSPALLAHVKALHAESIARSKANPLGWHTKQSHEWYELNVGVVGRRSLDNWREDFAEHYRALHKALYLTRTGADPEALARYAERFPGWARFWDAFYAATL